MVIRFFGQPGYLVQAEFQFTEGMLAGCRLGGIVVSRVYDRKVPADTGHVQVTLGSLIWPPTPMHEARLKTAIAEKFVEWERLKR